MSLAATTAIRDWINSRPIVGDGGPLSRGAYLVEQAAPADGAYAVISRNSEGIGSVVAEEDVFTRARLQAIVYAGTQDAAEFGAAALRSEWEKLRGCPEPCGETGVTVRVAENFTGPMAIPWMMGSSEMFGFQVGADFILMEA